MPDEVTPLQRMAAECEELSELLVAQSRQQIAEGLSEYGEDLQPLQNLAVFMRFLVERRNVNAAPRAVRILYAKLVDTLNGVTCLLQAGLPGPAAALARTLFETAVHFRVLLGGDLTERCRLFDNFILVERSRIGPGEGITVEQVAENAAAFERVRADYHPKKQESWCWKVVGQLKANGKPRENPRIRDLAREVGYLDYYEDIYGRLSAAVHPTPAYESWMRRPDGQMELGPKFGPHHPPIARVAAALVTATLLRLLEVLDPPDRLDLSRLLVALSATRGQQAAETTDTPEQEDEGRSGFDGVSSSSEGDRES